MSYQCILVLTLSLLATSVSLANPAATEKAVASSSALPKAQDPLFNKMLAEKPSIPMAQDTRFNKMFPEVHSEENDIEDEAKDALLPKKPTADLNPKYAQHAAVLKKLEKMEQQKQPKAESTTMGIVPIEEKDSMDESDSYEDEDYLPDEDTQNVTKVVTPKKYTESSTSTSKTPVKTSSAAPDDEYYNDDDEDSGEELENEKIDPLAINKLLSKNAKSTEAAPAATSTSANLTKSKPNASSTKSSTAKPTTGDNEILDEIDEDDEDYMYKDEYDDEDVADDKIDIDAVNKLLSQKKQKQKESTVANGKKTDSKSANQNYADYYDEDDEDDDDDYNLEEQAHVCPRDCICERNMHAYLVATCSRLDIDTQKFSPSITDLQVLDVGPKYPIVLSAEFFKQIGLSHVVSIKISNCTIEYISLKSFPERVSRRSLVLLAKVSG